MKKGDDDNKVIVEWVYCSGCGKQMRPGSDDMCGKCKRKEQKEDKQ